jgi:Clostridial hydrophobic W
VNTQSKAPRSGKRFGVGDHSLIALPGDRRRTWRADGQPLRFDELAGVEVSAEILILDHGLYALSLALSQSRENEQAGLLLPAVQVAKPPSERLDGIDIIASTTACAGWLGGAGGTVVVKAPRGGGRLVLTTYRRHGQPDDTCEVVVNRIGLPAWAPIERVAEVAAPPTRDIAAEVLLHIEGAGDCRVPAEGWIGNRGKKLRLEAFSIRPLETLAPGDVEYKAYGPYGRETPWISDGKLCGTRGRSLPLTGFAVRLAAQLGDRFGIEYQGAFFESGVCSPVRDGEPCLPRIADDPLEGVNLRLFERVDA